MDLSLVIKRGKIYFKENNSFQILIIYGNIETIT